MQECGLEVVAQHFVSRSVDKCHFQGLRLRKPLICWCARQD